MRRQSTLQLSAQLGHRAAHQSTTSSSTWQRQQLTETRSNRFHWVLAWRGRAAMAVEATAAAVDVQAGGCAVVLSDVRLVCCMQH
jgi:hypothetical protein